MNGLNNVVVVLIDVLVWSAQIEILTENKLKNKLAKDFTDRINKCQHGTFNFLYDSSLKNLHIHLTRRFCSTQIPNKEIDKSNDIRWNHKHCLFTKSLHKNYEFVHKSQPHKSLINIIYDFYPTGNKKYTIN